MPLTPEANLYYLLVCRSKKVTDNNCDCDVLDELLGLDVVHAVDTGNTVTEFHVSP